MAATGGGAVYQLAEVLLPRWVRRSKFYQATVARGLRITVEMVGGVGGVMPADRMPMRKLVARKAAGNVVELGGLLSVGWSPLWLLAAASDITGGTRTYLHALAAELKRAGLLSDDRGVTSFEDLLTRVERTSSALADTIDLPPMNVEDLRATWESFKQHAPDLPGPKDQEAIYSRLQQASSREGASLLEVSSIVALSALRAGFQLGNTHVFRYYQEALGAILEEGLPAYAQRIAAPYILTAGRHLDPGVSTYTERLLLRIERWKDRLRRAAP